MDEDKFAQGVLDIDLEVLPLVRRKPSNSRSTSEVRGKAAKG